MGCDPHSTPYSPLPSLAMLLPLHNLLVHLQTNTSHIEQQLRAVLAGWPTDRAAATADITIKLQLADELPPLPAPTPIFTDGGDRILHVYQIDEDDAWLHFLDGGLVRVPLNGATTIDGVVTAGLLGVNGRLEDVLYTSLAPLLRRRGLFMVHAFAASKNGRCVLLVGPTQSGKTTTGLSLLLHGWELLANDVVLLHQCDDGIYALPTPGTLGIRPKTFALLPQLHENLGLINGRWAAPSPVAALLFPQILNEREKTAVLPHHRAIALTQLMAESMDRWDTPTFAPHLTLLQQLCQQAATYQLHLGNNVDTIPAHIEQVIF